MAKAVDIRKPKKAANYRYEAVTSQGETVKGNIKATGEIEAERILIDRGYTPTHVEVVPSMFSLEEALPTLFQVKSRDVIVFSRQLATLLKSGISLLPALETLQGQVASSRVFKNILGSMVNDIRSGISFSQAIAKYPKAFNEIYSRTVAVGEQTGSLETVLNQMADYLERQSVFSQKIGKALTYPIMVLGVGIVVVILLMVVVMPNLIGMFTAMNVTLPLPTRILIFMTEFLTGNLLYLLITVSVLAVSVLWMSRQPAGRRFLDRLRLTMPILGPPALMMELGRFARSISVLVSAGLRLHEIMELLPQSTTNRYFQNALIKVRDGLLLGEGLAQPMSRIDIFPPLVIQMVNVGEESNTLDFTMGVVADFFETTAEEKMSAVVGLIGPASTMGIALVVGFIALSVIMPMYSLTGAF